MGVFSIVGGLVTLRLPETLNQKLPQTLEEGENFGQDVQWLSTLIRWESQPFDDLFGYLYFSFFYIICYIIYYSIYIYYYFYYYYYYYYLLFIIYFFTLFIIFYIIFFFFYILAIYIHPINFDG